MRKPQQLRCGILKVSKVEPVYETLKVEPRKFYKWNLHFGTLWNLVQGFRPLPQTTPKLYWQDLSFPRCWGMHGTSQKLTSYDEWNLHFGTLRNLTFYEWNLHSGTLRNLTFYECNLHVEPHGTERFMNGTFMWNLAEPNLL